MFYIIFLFLKKISVVLRNLPHCVSNNRNVHCRGLCKATEIFVRNKNVSFNLLFTPTHFVFWLIIFIYIFAQQKNVFLKSFRKESHIIIITALKKIW